MPSNGVQVRDEGVSIPSPLVVPGPRTYNGCVNPSSGPPPPGPRAFDPVLLGTACCIASALGYTAVNICLRSLADHAQLAWATCVKESVTVLVVGPWLLWRAHRGLPTMPSRRALLALALVGLVVQLVGNLGIIWSMSVVGLAVTIPAALGVSLAGSAVLGRVFLGERVSPRSMAALGLLIGSIVLLKMGVGGGGPSTAAGPVKTALAIGVACLAGGTYATLTVVIRKAVTGTTPIAAVMFIVTGMGVLSLGPLSVWQVGVGQLLHTPPRDFALMLLTGVLNLGAFLAITKGLQLTTIVHANVLSASQVAMAAAAGILLFAEHPNPALILGICLTILGMSLIGRRNGE